MMVYNLNNSLSQTFLAGLEPIMINQSDLDYVSGIISMLPFLNLAPIYLWVGSDIF